ncbi:RloB family protein [Methanomassiliicoccus luminyensis]|uniref:RloB family protein n=1 Tax=Methanomassiliicoccus luminyensis TaxID=1080712 RepID=UPI0003680A29|nr:RloB family protein [Methanomassiliicoccus luminyensis]
MNGLRRRKQSGRERRKLLYLVCEGERTEPIYFNNFRTPECDFRIIILSDHNNDPIGLVSRAIKVIDDEVFDSEYGDQVWCVFDVDQNSDEKLQAALGMATDRGISIALSNPCFEIWYYIHFTFCSSKLSRQDLLVKLDNYIKDYNKTMNVFECTKDMLPMAIKNAKKLNKMHEGAAVALIGTGSNPSSQVYRVIETINRMMQHDA